MDPITVLAATLRGLHLAAMLSLFGTAVFTLCLAPLTLRGRLLHLARASAGLAAGFGIAWFIVQAAVIAAQGSSADVLAALPSVAIYTRFGQLIALRLLLLLIILPLLGAGRGGLGASLALAAIAMAMQGAIGHVGVLGSRIGTGLIASEALHLLAAGAWLGGLLPLLMCLRRLPVSDAADLCQRFSPLGFAAVLVIAATGLAQAIELVGTVPALVGTEYGHLALLKATLFLVALGFAARNRLSLTDRLTEGDPRWARRQLTGSIAAETAVGVVIVLAAGYLASLAPSTHQQPVWPFPWRPSLKALQDPAARQEVLISVSAILAGLAGVAATLFWQRGRLVAALVAAGLIAWRAPSLEPLLVKAYPTSFQISPTGFSAAAIVHGRTLFAANCAVCHGASGQGDGPAAAAPRRVPTDLTRVQHREHSDGELFWSISEGVEEPDGGAAMPGFATSLSPIERWELVDFLHANNAGAFPRATGTLPSPLAVPAMPIQCADAAISQMSDLRGKVVLMIAAPPPKTPLTLPPQAGFPIMALHLTGSEPGAGCIAGSPDAWIALSAIAGVSPDQLAGTEFLVDPDGWLRMISRPGDRLGWGNADLLLAAIRAVSEHPISTAPGGGHEHHD